MTPFRVVNPLVQRHHDSQQRCLVFPRKHAIVAHHAATLTSVEGTLSIGDHRIKVHSVHVEPIEKSSELLGRNTCSFPCRHVSVVMTAAGSSAVS